MKDYGEEYPVQKIDTREIAISAIIIGLCTITFIAVVWMPY